MGGYTQNYLDMGVAFVAVGADVTLQAKTTTALAASVRGNANRRALREGSSC